MALMVHSTKPMEVKVHRHGRLTSAGRSLQPTDTDRAWGVERGRAETGGQAL